MTAGAAQKHSFDAIIGSVLSWPDLYMQLELMTGFREPCLVSEPTLQLTCHVLGHVTTANTARVLRYLSLNACNHAFDETFLLPTYFRVAPSYALFSRPTAHRVYR